MCDCVDQLQFTEWYEEECKNAANSTVFEPTFNTTAPYSEFAKADSDYMFQNIDPLSIIVALVTGLAMLALIALSALFARYRKRQSVVASLECGNAQLKSEFQEAKALNADLKKALEESQQVVDRNMKESSAVLEAFKINYADLSLGVRLGEGSFGTVYHGAFRGKECAIKTVRVSKVTDETVKAFLGEIILMAPLRHQNLVQLIGGCWTDGPDKQVRF